MRRLFLILVTMLLAGCDVSDPAAKATLDRIEGELKTANNELKAANKTLTSIDTKVSSPAPTKRAIVVHCNSANCPTPESVIALCTDSGGFKNSKLTKDGSQVVCWD
jgi:uncharacterized lipoprotein